MYPLLGFQFQPFYQIFLGVLDSQDNWHGYDELERPFISLLLRVIQSSINCRISGLL